MIDINQKLLEAFQVEHVEHLEGIRACLAGWEQGSVTAEIDEAFRRAHSLKGAARVTGLTDVEALAHRLESLFSQLRNGTLGCDLPVLHAIRSALDAIEDMSAHALHGAAPRDLEPILAELDQASNPSARAPHPKSALPTQAAQPAPQPAVRTIETVRLNSEHLDHLLVSTGQLATENLQQESLTRELTAVHQQLDAVRHHWESLKRAATGTLLRLDARAEMADVIERVDLVGHHFNALSRRVRNVQRMQRQSSWSVRLLTQQLQADIRRVRMAPAESEFQGFRKMMRDLARDQQKELDFNVVGLDVLADRMVLQALKDPLMHLLRNAITHGIEPPAERRQKGKAAAGTVSLALSVTGDRLHLEVTDDGRGVDLLQVADVAVRCGIMTETEVATLAPDELLPLLFQPGFSTAANLTELSGRGMGLSTVYEAVSRLQGEVDVQRRPAGGTSVVVRVPLSICTHRLLLVRCRDQVIAIPFYGIDSLYRIDAADVSSVEGLPMVALDDRLMPLTSLESLLDPSRIEPSAFDDALPVVVIRSGTKRVAAGVQKLVAERNALILKLGAPADSHSSLLGGILLEDGGVAPVVNPAELVNRFKPAKRIAATPLEWALSKTEAPTILVVDDSFTTRTLETSILEAHGYRVRIAVDGVDALKHLRSDRIDLVITDVQMPRLDGFGLLAAIKQDPRLAHIPVIIVSSVDGADDQERGLRLGADAYIVKRKFDHQDLLQTVQQLV